MRKYKKVKKYLTATNISCIMTFVAVMGYRQMVRPVSYTHLDVYKRQRQQGAARLDIDDDFGGGEESEWMVGREPSSGEESE